jgi:hypothetical protein
MKNKTDIFNKRTKMNGIVGALRIAFCICFTTIFSTFKCHAGDPAIPPQIDSAYRSIYSMADVIRLDGYTENNDTKYYQLSASSQNAMDDTDAILAQNPDGTISWLDKGMDPGTDPCFVITDSNVWKPLQDDFVRRQTQTLGAGRVQEILNTRFALSKPMAQSYQDAGYTIPSTMRIFADSHNTVQVAGPK